MLDACQVTCYMGIMIMGIMIMGNRYALMYILYLFRPEFPSLQYVFKVVSDDVGLLKEQAH